MSTPPPDLIAPEQWYVYRSVIREARRRKVRFAVGGAFSLATYTNVWRNTKDLDLYTLRDDRDALIEVLRDYGLRDYYEKLPYDRYWIYRGYTGETIVDIIWAMANHRADVDEQWLMNGPEVELNGEIVQVISAEEIVRDKLYIMQRDRCDTPDVINLIYAVGPDLDWERILTRLEDDCPLLAAVLTSFGWLCPGRAQDLPRWLWSRLKIPLPPDGPDKDERHIRLWDSRPWLRAERK